MQLSRGTRSPTQSIVQVVTACTTLWKIAFAQSTSCEFLSWLPKGQFSFNNNVWGAQDQDGHQCITVWPSDFHSCSFLTKHEVASDAASFNVTWQWERGSISQPVHSFPYVRFNSRQLPGSLWDIDALKVAGSWEMFPTIDPSRGMESTEAIANVAIDMFLDADEDNADSAESASHEVMIWFATYNGGPPFGNATSVSHQVSVQPGEVVTFQLYDGRKTERDQRVLSWQVNPPVPRFDIDVLSFIRVLEENGFMTQDMYLGLVELGSETFYSPENITFSASEFGMNLSSNATPTGRPFPSSGADGPGRGGWGRPSMASPLAATQWAAAWTVLLMFALLRYL